MTFELQIYGYPVEDGDGVSSIPIPSTKESEVAVDIPDNVQSGVLARGAESAQLANSDAQRTGSFMMGALQTVALKQLDEVGAVESRATDTVMGGTGK